MFLTLDCKTKEGVVLVVELMKNKNAEFYESHARDMSAIEMCLYLNSVGVGAFISDDTDCGETLL